MRFVDGTKVKVVKAVTTELVGFVGYAYRHVPLFRQGEWRWAYKVYPRPRAYGEPFPEGTVYCEEDDLEPASEQAKA